MYLGNQERRGGANQPFAVAVVGHKRQGKSSHVRDMITYYISERKNNRVLVHDYSGSSAFSDIELITVDELEKLLKLNAQNPKWGWKKGMRRVQGSNEDTIKRIHDLVHDYLTDAMVVFDECTLYMRGNVKDWKLAVLNNHGNKNVIPVYIFHSYAQLPPSYGRFIDRFVCMNTGEDIIWSDFKGRYARPKTMFDTAKRINATKPTNKRVQPFETVFRNVRS